MKITIEFTDSIVRSYYIRQHIEGRIRQGAEAKLTFTHPDYSECARVEVSEAEPVVPA